MKTISFMIAAVALVGLGSCSNEEPDTTDSYGLKVNNGVLNVQVEELQYEGLTRSAYTPTGNKLTWQKGDAIYVYDQQLTTYDVYDFSAADRAYVTSQTESAIEGEVSYALFPAQQVDYAGWTSKGNRAVINLPSTIVYDANGEDASSGTTLYCSRLPMWGTAEGVFGNVTVSLKYLCAVMKLKVDRNKASFVKISSASMPLSGGFEAVIAKNGVTESEPMMKQGGKSLGTQKYIIVDLRQMPSSDGYVYVPIIPGTYDDLTVSYTNESVALGTELTKSQIADKEENFWKVLKVYPVGKVFARNIVYPVTL